MAQAQPDWGADDPTARDGAVTVGNFDGVHRGHQALLAETVRQARAVGGPAVAVTFDPHPLRFLAPDLDLALLTTPADRAELLRAGGADVVVTLRTSPELLALGPDEFFERVLLGQLRARAMVEGENFRFGRQRTGDVTVLCELCRHAGIPLAVVPPIEVAGEPVSSSRARTALLEGDVGLVRELLGRPYRVRGRVAMGQRRGRELGFPTANLEGVETLLPRDGVYAARALVDGTPWPAAVNVGPNPTFGEQARKLEAHLIGFTGDLYGRPVALDFLARLRETRPFASVAQLLEQLRMDVAATRDVMRHEQ